MYKVMFIYLSLLTVSPHSHKNHCSFFALNNQFRALKNSATEIARNWTNGERRVGAKKPLKIPVRRYWKKR